jgi:hypothetical protein
LRAVRARVDSDSDSTLAFEAYGVPLLLEVARPELRPRIDPLLPPGWKPCPETAVERRLALAEAGDQYEVRLDGTPLSSSADLDVVLEVLAGQIRSCIAQRSPELFVHAGAVAYEDRAIVIPGPSFSGKTTLVAALVNAGARYYSDEFAVLDGSGRVHPYAKPLSIRDGNAISGPAPLAPPAGQPGDTPLPIGLIAVTRYSPSAAWRPECRSPGEGALALLSNTVPIRDRPAEALATVGTAAASALVLEGDRGEAAEMAPDLLTCCAASA